MSELIQQMLQNGQELQTGDVNNLGLNALMDDRVIAELVRMAPFTGTVAKLIMPYAVDANDAVDQSTTVQPTNSANGSVFIAPFRAIVGSRTAVGTDALKSWRDIRSGVYVGGQTPASTVPATTLKTTQLLTANVSGQARWDVIYAIIPPDANTAAVNRAIKAPTTGVVTATPTVTQLATPVALGYTVGTPAASPQFPAIPVDSGGNYYVALAYILIPNGFGAASTVKSWMIAPAGPAPISLSKGLGGCNAAPANQSNISGGQVVTSTSVPAWANNSTSSISARPNTYMPPDMIGMETLWGAIDLSGAVPGSWSHQSLTNVDTSRDWRNRIFRVMWMAQPPTGSGGHFSWDRAAGATSFGPRTDVVAGTSFAQALHTFEGFGQSFIVDGANLPGSPPASSSIVSLVTHTQLTNVDAGVTGAACALYVDQSTGNLRVYISLVSNNCTLFFWLMASRPYGDY